MRCLTLALLALAACGPAPYETASQGERTEMDAPAIGTAFHSAPAKPEQLDLGRIGKECVGPTFPESLCGKGNRVAGIYVDTSDANAASGFLADTTSRVHIDGARITVEAQCVDCNAHMGWMFVGDLSLLTKGQRRDLQRRMHLPDEPLLESQDEWSAAIGRALPVGAQVPLSERSSL